MHTLIICKALICHYKKTKDPAVLPGNITKANNISQLQKQWKCPACQDKCVGTYCYQSSNLPDEHLPLSHEKLDCWASAMVCGRLLVVFHLLIINR